MKPYIQRWTLTPIAMLVLMGGATISRAQETAPATQTTDAPPPPPDGARPGPPRGGPEHRLAMLQHELSLSTDQTAQVKSILASERTQMEALRNGGTSQEERHTQMQTIRQTTNAAIKATLTADQAAKFDAMEARMRAHRPGQDGPPPPDGAAPPNQ